MASHSSAHGRVVPGLAAAERGLWRQAAERLAANRLALAAVLLLAVIGFTAVAGEVTAVVGRHDPAEQNYTLPDGESNIDRPPSTDHWLGTDGLGRDVWARVLQATLFSLRIGIGAEVIVVIIGLSLGMLAALGGRLRRTAHRQRSHLDHRPRRRLPGPADDPHHPAGPLRP